ncbi:hypothetical protein SAMN05421821_11031 [Mucilaginibacter lappiensis]|uniref:Uncharacterized protein n=1 Tax=Mucilaginibacter lappiensis TaxID=354630 RepID=A0ABR6PN43_9SPHI|nr:hypothetical protein [Mucilaginibacter lappiensis]SIR67229.1 hypothetical protein SAMN05421821_11031 [Mucilaginibacter lappiensis]
MFFLVNYGDRSEFYSKNRIETVFKLPVNDL